MDIVVFNIVAQNKRLDVLIVNYNLNNLSLDI